MPKKQKLYVINRVDLSNGDKMMDERLVIRLATQAHQINKWLVWSDIENEIIASGEVENSEQLALLSERANSRLVICLLPCVDVLIKAVIINGKLNRQLEQALPYMIEDDLATDVEQLHFSVFEKQKDLVHVAICDKNKIKMWQSWLSDAQITCTQFIPEVLALTAATPATAPALGQSDWYALKFADLWLIRENKYIGWGYDAKSLNLILSTKIDEDNIQNIVSYSEFDENFIGNWSCPEPIIAMGVLAKGTLNNTINLLSGEFAIQKKFNLQIRRWRNTAIVAIILFFFLLVNTYTQALQAEKKTLNVQTQVQSIYKQLFPHLSPLKYSRIKKKINSIIKNTEQAKPSAFLLLVKDLAPYFSMDKDIKMLSLTYQRDKNQITILALGKNFKTFETFQKMLPKTFLLTEGPLDTKPNGVTGLLTIRRK